MIRARPCSHCASTHCQDRRKEIIVLCMTPAYTHMLTTLVSANIIYCRVRHGGFPVSRQLCYGVIESHKALEA
jgi:predicted Rdx family selenoprotein